MDVCMGVDQQVALIPTPMKHCKWGGGVGFLVPCLIF